MADCFNRNCPFRVNGTSNDTCECVACPNRCNNDFIITSNRTLTDNELALLEAQWKKDEDYDAKRFGGLTMAEYIDRKAFKDKYLCCGYLPEMSEEEFDAFPAADVATVQHGRWISGLSGDYKICSGCHQIADFAFDYCPNCGSFMDGVRN